MTDETEKLLRDLDTGLANAPLKKTSAAHQYYGNDHLTRTMLLFREPKFDNTMGFISNPLAYSRLFSQVDKNTHKAIIRLLRGRWLIALLLNKTPDEGTIAKRDSPYGERHYLIAINPEK